MSKSRGNVVSPDDIIAKFGAAATRRSYPSRADEHEPSTLVA